MLWDTHFTPPFLYTLILPIKKQKFSFSGHFVGLALFSKGFVNGCNGNFVDKKRRRLAEQLFFAFFGQFGRKKPKEPLKRCNALSSLLRTPSLLIYTCGLVGIFS